MPETEAIAVPKRRGRPKRVVPVPEPLTGSQAERYLKQIIGEKRFEEAAKESDIERLVEKYRPLMEKALAWEAQEPCPKCNQRPGYNPITGIRVRSWVQATMSYIDGHRHSCETLQPNEPR